MADSNDPKETLLLAQWQTCLQMANSISQRRDTMNNLFVTLNLAIMAAVSIKLDVPSILMLAVGMIFCSLWLVFIRNYKQLLSAKFAVINNIEKALPCHPFSDEWEKLKSKKSQRKYTDGTKLEQYLPIMFVVIYVVTAVYIIIMASK